MSIHLKRAYDEPEEGDGYRVLVDRIWPRGVSKESLQLDEWLKDIAPSDELRKWFDHDPDKFEEFNRRYREELSRKNEQIRHLAKIARSQDVTLIFGAKDTEHNQAVVFKEYLEEIE